MALKEDPDINRIINYLCLMMDELEEKIKNKVPIRSADLLELADKSTQLSDMAKELEQFSTDAKP